MTAREDIAHYTLMCVEEKLEPCQLKAVTTRTTLILKQLVTVIANLCTIFYMVFHIQRYGQKSRFDGALGCCLTLIWISCLLFELLYSFRGEVHLLFEEYKALVISIICVIIVIAFEGEVTAIAILLFMCVEIAMTAIKCAIGGLNPNALQNLINTAGYDLKSVPRCTLSQSGYFSGSQLIKRDFADFIKT